MKVDLKSIFPCTHEEYYLVKIDGTLNYITSDKEEIYPLIDALKMRGYNNITVTKIDSLFNPILESTFKEGILTETYENKDGVKTLAYSKQ